MGVVFAILGGIIKWILLTILGLIGLVLVLLLVVTLTPLRYKINWVKQADTMEGDVRISWLLHLITFRLTQKGKEIQWVVKIGPKRIAASEPLPKKEKKSKKAKKRIKKKPPQAENGTQAPQEIRTPVTLPEETLAEEPLQEPFLSESAVSESTAAIPGEPVPLPTVEEELREEESPEPIPAAPEPKKGWRRKVTDVCWKIRRLFEKIVGKVRGVVEGIRAIPVKVRGLLDKWDQVKAIWEGYPQKSETVEAVKRLVGGLLKAPLPKRYQVELRVGMKDPATTGQILMYYYALTPILFPKTTRRRRFVLEAEFEEPVLEVTAMCKGRFSLGSFIWPVIRALLNAHIRRLIRYVLSIKKNSSQKEI